MGGPAQGQRRSGSRASDRSVTRRAARRLAATALSVLALAPAAAQAQHTNLAHESIGPAGGNGAFAADAAGFLDQGRTVLFSTSEPLVAADPDAALDLYSRFGGTATLHTGGSGAYPATTAGVRVTGSRVLFQTEERLVGTDTDSSLDVYSRVGAVTSLLSTGTAGGNGAFDSLFAGASEDGARVFFVTRESMHPTDTDASVDLYERAGGSTALVSTGPAGGNGDPGAELVGVSADGAKVFFHTRESLVPEDTDTARDVYQRSSGQTALLSTGPVGGNGADSATFAASSRDGSKVFFTTREPLLAADTDDNVDVYERADATTAIHSVGPSGGNSGAPAGLAGISEDGSVVFLETAEKLIPNPVDRDAQSDVYRSAGGALTLASPGGNDTVATPAYFAGASADGSRVLIRSEEALVPGDTDKYQDIYEGSDGGLTRISLGTAGGNGPAHAFLGGISDDGTSIFFETAEQLAPTDADTNVDVYERNAGVTYHLSRGAGGGNGAFDATLSAVSPGGERAVFRTAESLLPSDTDAVADVYSANVPATLTVVLDAVPDDPQDFSFTAAGGLSPAGFVLDDDTDVTHGNARTFGDLAPGSGYSIAQAAAAGWTQVSATCSNGSPVSNIELDAGEAVTCTFVNQRGYPRPKTASPVDVSLVPAFAECLAPNRLHGPPLVFASCHPPAQRSLPVTAGTPDANGAPAGMSGRAHFQSVSGTPETPADEADVAISFTVGDVRVRSTLGDYPGELAGVVVLRVTDRLNGTTQNEVGTVSDVPLSLAVPCTINADPSKGATCSSTTSADAVIPGMVSESKRTIWEMADVQVHDGGSDGVASTPQNTLFLTQGVFIP